MKGRHPHRRGDLFPCKNPPVHCKPEHGNGLKATKLN